MAVKTTVKRNMFSLPATKRRTIVETVPFQVSAKNLSEITSSTADRSRLSVRQQLRIQCTIVTGTGGSLNNMSMSLLWRQRNAALEKSMKKIKAHWLLSKPKFVDSLLGFQANSTSLRT